MRSSALLLALALLTGCTGQGPCANGGSTCAAAAAPAGMRQTRQGYRMVNIHWMEKTNKESGVPDIGVRADWEPFREKR